MVHGYEWMRFHPCDIGLEFSRYTGNINSLFTQRPFLSRLRELPAQRRSMSVWTQQLSRHVVVLSTLLSGVRRENIVVITVWRTHFIYTKWISVRNKSKLRHPCKKNKFVCCTKYNHRKQRKTSWSVDMPSIFQCKYSWCPCSVVCQYLKHTG